MSGRAWPWQVKTIRKAAQEVASASMQRTMAEQQSVEPAAEPPPHRAPNPRRSFMTFTSFDQAFAELQPDQGGPDYALGLLRDPMSLKGRVVAVRAEVVQVVDGDHLLLNPCRDVQESCLAMGTISSHYGGSREFVDEQPVALVAEVVGTYRYTTPLGVEKTVPEMLLYGVRAGH